ncbi:hydroxymethylglutaryl-CoA lyase [Desulfovermiculus halophilus]|jgi:hydroxymethylglutaryl-CoA lyase|uniref:hydroxymethylglutaryl-CoA lyase n=1 Tax=Desulfovermiculus halophilus TaxID=339722 RepID=UPI0005545660|nr:hydroxymethylglutaryl-CoA lyase [Desulfovermiculus halophilus]
MTDDHEYVSLVEVGPRDGLQFEDKVLCTQDKLDFIACVRRSGLRRIQVVSFVHPRRVPQMADAEQLVHSLSPSPEVEYSALVLNRTGLDRALSTPITCVEISVSASSTHSRRNTGMNRQEALAQATDMTVRARAAGLAVRASLQCAFGCVYEGSIDPRVVSEMAQALMDAGAQSLALADTTGMGHPESVRTVIAEVNKGIPSAQMALHLHDTLGFGLVNLVAGLDCGVRCFDVSCGGLGGCPFVPGAAGNIATEDTVYLLHALGYTTGVDWTGAAACTQKLEEVLGRRLPAKLRPGQKGVL